MTRLTAEEDAARNEQCDARYLRSAIAKGEATTIMDMVREMDSVVAELGLAESSERPSDCIRTMKIKLGL